MTPERRAKRNADAYTAFVVMSALSTGVFLAGTGLSVWSGLRYGKAAGTEQLLRAASRGSEDLFDESGEISREAQSAAAAVPGLTDVLERVEEKAADENKDVQTTLREMEGEARAERRKQQKFLIGTGVAAGAGLVGMLVFISAAKIARHRGIMLMDRSLGRRVQAQWAPRLSPQEMGLQFSLKF
ncbi:hypothetical protein FBR05_01520 [Deltaproteobacteria bacterium PRO3]|nr:hypothetical protein [Deltaproteobacteria bacterium PRO3]